MLYMIVNTHSAESCAFRSEDDAKALVQSGVVGRTHTRVVSVLSTADVTVDTGD